MIKHYKFSKRLHLATLCCFLLPFFYTGCGPSAEEKAAAEKANQDSIAAVEASKIDTSIIERTSNKPVDTIIENQAIQPDTNIKQLAIQPADSTSSNQVDTSKDQVTSSQSNTTSSKQNPDDNPSEKISNKFTFLRPLLIPKPYTYTGIATVINSIYPVVCYCATFISFLFLILSLVVKFIDIGARRSVVLLDILGLCFLIISVPFPYGDKLYGFWVAVTFASILAVYDIYIIKLNKRLKTE
jgi:hypothetical protein